MRILVINWQDRLNPLAGGAETHLHEVFGRLVARGHQVTLLVSGWADGPRRAEVDGLDVHRTGGRYTFSMAAPLYYRRRLAGREFDVMIEDLNKVPLFTPSWAKHPLALLVHHLFGATAFQEAALPVAAATWLLEQPLGRFYRRVPTMAVSRSTALDLGRRGLPVEDIAVIPNGVDLERYAPAAGVERCQAPTVLYLGRLKRYKRVDLPIRAVAALREQGVAARLIVAGTGDQAGALRRLRDELGLGDVVEFRGFVTEEEKLTLFRRAWVHVLTSPKEGWGITNVEAAACGTPTVASDSPGLRDSVLDGETGFLVPHGDVDALAARLRILIEDSALREDLGRKARRFAERFSWERAATATESFLRGVARAA
jgi:glycosyltransferase involved in cell wall biosynthesis